jgi:hypothetical protein
MHSLKVLKKRYTFPEAVERAVDFRRPIVHNDRHLFTQYAQAAERFARIGSGLKVLCRDFLDFQIAPPEIHAFEASAAALPYSDTVDVMEYRFQQAIATLATALNVPQLGRVTWSDDESCQFTYYDVVWDYGILRNNVRRVAHQHDVVKARLHKLPADDVPMPKRGREILRAIPAPLHPYTRVITGLEVRKLEREESSRQESTWLGKTLSRGKRQLKTTGTAVAAGLSAAGAAVLTGIGGALSLATAPLAIADPAIVVGELCLFGWEN